MNSILIKQGTTKEERYSQFFEIAQYQLEVPDNKEKKKSLMLAAKHQPRIK